MGAGGVMARLRAARKANVIRWVLVATAITVPVVACGDGPTPPDNTVTLRNRIVFAVDTGPYPLMSMKPDGSDRRPIPVVLPSLPAAPAVSPDGREVAFGLAFSEIYVVNSDGTGLRNVTNSGALDILPRWSPDGGEIAFSSNRGVNGQYNIYAIRLADSTVRLLSDLPGSKALSDWSRDGTTLLATIRIDTTLGDIWAIPIGLGDARQLTTAPADDGGAVFAPDNHVIAFSGARNRGTELLIINADGSSERPISVSDSSHGYAPHWSPDGQWLVYSDGGAELWKARVDGTAFVDLGRGFFPTWGPAE